VKRLYLLRHAKSDWADSGLADADRPLNARGRKAARAMGRYMRREGLQPALVLCSTARRTRQTWDILARELRDEAPADYADALYLADPGQMLRRLGEVSDTTPSLLLIGHNPGLQALALRLAAGGDKTARRLMATKYPTGALAVFDIDVESWDQLASGTAVLERFVAPRDLD
jgi:phosphohistidine phosphatase